MAISGFSAENPGIFYAVSGLQSFILRADFKTGVAFRQFYNADRGFSAGERKKRNRRLQDAPNNGIL